MKRTASRSGFRRRIGLATAGLALAALAVGAVAAPVRQWKVVPVSGLDVTSGVISNSGTGWLQTDSDEMRAVQLDHGHHAASARLEFRFLGKSAMTKPLGSGLVRRQIGLKLDASDPCNLLYVMWRTYPDHVIEVSIKRNPGQTTSAECGNAGYSDVAVIPETAKVFHRHLLEADTTHEPDGSLGLAIYTDGKLLRQLTLPPSEVAGLDGPIGIRSDNGRYRFVLSVPSANQRQGAAATTR
jgi:hypothetical protein